MPIATADPAENQCSLLLHSDHIEDFETPISHCRGTDMFVGSGSLSPHAWLLHC